MATLSTILSPGSKVGDNYEILEVIGFGGMGVVYKVREHVGGASRTRALKTVLPQYRDDEKIVRRFREEAEKMCVLEHENIVPVLSYSERGEFPYLIMPFIEGQTLKQYLAEHLEEHGRPLPLSEVLTIGLEVARGLEAAHGFVDPQTGRSQPMIHRDIKPGNIMIRVEHEGNRRRLRVLLMDLGIAKVMSDEEGGQTQTDVMGTLKYAPPEQVRRTKDVDARADIYALGMVLYELAMGRHMLGKIPEGQLLMRFMQPEIEEHEPEFDEGTPELFEKLIRRCVSVDPDKRFSSVAEMRPLMQRILDEYSDRARFEGEALRRQAQERREAALERDAKELVPDGVAEAEDLLAQAEGAMDSGHYGSAVRLYEQAAAAFAEAAEAAAKSRDAEAEAVRERRRQEIGHALKEVVRSVATEGARYDALPAGLAPSDGIEQLARAKASTSAAEVALNGNHFAEAEEEIDRARQAAERAAALHDEALRSIEEQVDEFATELERRLAAIESSGHQELAPQLFDEVRSTRDAAERSRRSRQSAQAYLSFSRALSDLERLERTIEQRLEQNEAATKRAEKEAEEARERADRLRAGAPLTSPDVRVRMLCDKGLSAWTSAEHQRATGDSFGAAISYRLAEESYQGAIQAENERLRGLVTELRRKASVAVGNLQELGERVTSTPEVQSLMEEFGDAERAIGEEDLPHASSVLERIVPELARQVEIWSARLEREQQRNRALEHRRAANAALETARKLGDHATGDTAFERGRKGLESGEERMATEEFTRAAEAFEAAAETLEELSNRVGDRLREERLAALGQRREELAGRLAGVSAQLSRRDRRTVHRALKNASKSLSNKDEEGARIALAEGESVLQQAPSLARAETVVDGETVVEGETVVTPPPRKRGAPVAIAGGIAAAVVLALGAIVWTQMRSEPAGGTRVAARPTTSAPSPSDRPATGETETGGGTDESVASSDEAIPGAKEDTETAAEAPSETADGEKEEAQVAKAVIPETEPTAPPVERKPTAPPELALAEASPSSRSLRLARGKTQSFAASVSGAGDDALSWELDGEPVGRGSSLVVGRQENLSPGTHRLELVAERTSRREVLSTWRLEVVEPKLTFVRVEPRDSTVETTPGDGIRFQTSVSSNVGENVDLSWSLDGRRVASGTDYRFDPEGPGEYAVEVRARAPSGTSVLRRWNVAVRKPTPDPQALKAGVRQWIDEYCAAFERGDVDKLLELGHLQSQSDAARLRRVLENQRELELTCTDAQIELSGNRAQVRFERTDRFVDPRGREIEGVSQVEKTLRRGENGWIAVR